MRSTLYLVVSALATVAVADQPNAFKVPNGGYQFKTGEPTTLKWEPSTDGTISLKLQSGEVSTPESGTTIASHIDNSGSYTWTPPKDIPDQSDYTIEIMDDSNEEESNYLPRFSVAGATASASSTSAASTSSVSATTSSASTSSTTDSPSTMTTTTASTTRSSPSSTASSTKASSSSTTGTSSRSASTTSYEAVSGTSAAAASETTADFSAGMVNRVSGGMMAIVLGAMAIM